MHTWKAKWTHATNRTTQGPRHGRGRSGSTTVGRKRPTKGGCREECGFHEHVQGGTAATTAAGGLEPSRGVATFRRGSRRTHASQAGPSTGRRSNSPSCSQPLWPPSGHETREGWDRRRRICSAPVSTSLDSRTGPFPTIDAHRFVLSLSLGDERSPPGALACRGNLLLRRQRTHPRSGSWFRATRGTCSLPVGSFLSTRDRLRPTCACAFAAKISLFRLGFLDTSPPFPLGFPSFGKGGCRSICPVEWFHENP